MTAPVRESEAPVPPARDYIIASMIAEGALWSVCLQLETIIAMGQFCGPDMVLRELSKVSTFTHEKMGEVADMLRGER